MISPTAAVHPEYARTAMGILHDLLGGYHPRDFRIRLWDGTVWEAEKGVQSRFTFVVNNPGVLRRLLREPRELLLAEAYLSKDLDIEGDLAAAFGMADHLIDRKMTALQKLKLGLQLIRLPPPGRPERKDVRLAGKRHSRERDRRAIAYHYDLSNDFYRLWLDRAMVYSCAYFERPDQDLDTAQQQKLDYLCRKLRLQQGDRLLDIGCGWGGLIVHAARRYGVTAVGITLSRAQAGLAQERIMQQGLERTCTVELRDYRDVAGSGRFDKIVSVGMFEHVGRRSLAEYFRKAWRLLRPGGVFLNHGIAMDMTAPARKGPTFTDSYIFPDGDLIPVSSTLQIAESSGFEVRDVESLREHYAITLRHWLGRLDAHRAEAVGCTSEFICRLWRLYLAASAHGFATGRTNVYQSLLVRTDQGRSGLPLTRRDWYR